jgi:hypothetical protein
MGYAFWWKIIDKRLVLFRIYSYLSYVIKMIPMIYEPLINRMSTDNVNRILEYNQNCPASGKSLIDSLMVIDSWLDLKYDSVCTLNDVFDCGYSPASISNLFTSK